MLMKYIPAGITVLTVRIVQKRQIIFALIAGASLLRE